MSAAAGEPAPKRARPSSVVPETGSVLLDWSTLSPHVRDVLAWMQARLTSSKIDVTVAPRGCIGLVDHRWERAYATEMARTSSHLHLLWGVVALDNGATGPTALDAVLEAEPGYRGKTFRVAVYIDGVWQVRHAKKVLEVKALRTCAMVWVDSTGATTISGAKTANYFRTVEREWGVRYNLLLVPSEADAASGCAESFEQCSARNRELACDPLLAPVIARLVPLERAAPSVVELQALGLSPLSLKAEVELYNQARRLFERVAGLMPETLLRWIYDVVERAALAESLGPDGALALEAVHEIVDFEPESNGGGKRAQQLVVELLVEAAGAGAGDEAAGVGDTVDGDGGRAGMVAVLGLAMVALRYVKSGALVKLEARARRDERALDVDADARADDSVAAVGDADDDDDAAVVAPDGLVACFAQDLERARLALLETLETLASAPRAAGDDAADAADAARDDARRAVGEAVRPLCALGEMIPLARSLGGAHPAAAWALLEVSPDGNARRTVAEWQAMLGTASFVVGMSREEELGVMAQRVLGGFMAPPNRARELAGKHNVAVAIAGAEAFAVAAATRAPPSAADLAPFVKGITCMAALGVKGSNLDQLLSALIRRSSASGVSNPTATDADIEALAIAYYDECVLSAAKPAQNLADKFGLGELLRDSIALLASAMPRSAVAFAVRTARADHATLECVWEELLEAAGRFDRHEPLTLQWAAVAFARITRLRQIDMQRWSLEQVVGKRAASAIFEQIKRAATARSSTAAAAWAGAAIGLGCNFTPKTIGLLDPDPRVKRYARQLLVSDEDDDEPAADVNSCAFVYALGRLVVDLDSPSVYQEPVRQRYDDAQKALERLGDYSPNATAAGVLFAASALVSRTRPDDLSLFVIKMHTAGCGCAMAASDIERVNSTRNGSTFAVCPECRFLARREAVRALGLGEVLNVWGSAGGGVDGEAAIGAHYARASAALDVALVAARSYEGETLQLLVPRRARFGDTRGLPTVIGALVAIWAEGRGEGRFPALLPAQLPVRLPDGRVVHKEVVIAACTLNELRRATRDYLAEATAVCGTDAFGLDRKRVFDALNSINGALANEGVFNAYLRQAAGSGATFALNPHVRPSGAHTATIEFLGGETRGLPPGVGSNALLSLLELNGLSSTWRTRSLKQRLALVINIFGPAPDGCEWPPGPPRWQLPSAGAGHALDSFKQKPSRAGAKEGSGWDISSLKEYMLELGEAADVVYPEVGPQTVVSWLVRALKAKALPQPGRGGACVWTKDRLEIYGETLVGIAVKMAAEMPMFTIAALVERFLGPAGKGVYPAGQRRTVPIRGFAVFLVVFAGLWRSHHIQCGMRGSCRTEDVKHREDAATALKLRADYLRG